MNLYKSLIVRLPGRFDSLYLMVKLQIAYDISSEINEVTYNIVSLGFCS